MYRFHQLTDAVTEYARNDKTSFSQFTNDPTYDAKASQLVIMSLNHFIRTHLDEEYDGEIATMKERNPTWFSEYPKDTPYQVFLLVDLDTTKLHTMDKKTKKMYRKCGAERRRRLHKKYYYEVPDNRIHAYIVVEDKPGLTDDKTLAINIVCSSNYSDIKGIGSYLLTAITSSAKKVGYKDLVLEVGSDEMEDPEDSDDEEESEEEEEESDEEEEDEEEDDEEDDVELICEMISRRLWKKSVRHKANNIPYYSFSDDYLMGRIMSVVLDTEEEKERVTFFTGDEHGYGGYYYHKAKRSSKKLINYYESLGFKEDPKVHLEWECFSHLPFPSMRLAL
jgi:hypothetical protein